MTHPLHFTLTSTFFRHSFASESFIILRISAWFTFDNYSTSNAYYILSIVNFNWRSLSNFLIISFRAWWLNSMTITRHWLLVHYKIIFGNTKKKDHRNWPDNEITTKKNWTINSKIGDNDDHVALIHLFECECVSEQLFN